MKSDPLRYVVRRSIGDRGVGREKATSSRHGLHGCHEGLVVVLLMEESMKAIMELPERDWQVVKKERDEWTKWLSEWHWQFFLTLRLHDKSNHARAEACLKRYRERIRDKEGECAYMGVYVGLGNPHLHLLMLGFEKEEFWWLTLAADLDRYWRQVTGKEAHVQRVYYDRGIAEYIALMNTPNGLHEWVKPHNRKMLDRNRVAPVFV